MGNRTINRSRSINVERLCVVCVCACVLFALNSETFACRHGVVAVQALFTVCVTKLTKRRRTELSPVATCCKQVDHVFVRRVRGSIAPSLLLLVARIGAGLRYVEASLSVQNLMVILMVC